MVFGHHVVVTALDGSDADANPRKSKIMVAHFATFADVGEF